MAKVKRFVSLTGAEFLDSLRVVFPVDYFSQPDRNYLQTVPLRAARNWRTPMDELPFATLAAAMERLETEGVVFELELPVSE
jgi:hypothetical protein